MRPLISIITPCLNQAEYLPRCLASVASEAGTLPPGAVEHIIMDGGSADGSDAIIRTHAIANPRLVTHWCSKPDNGQSSAINAGFEVARGDFGAWLNADDWYEPGSLRVVVEHLARSDAPDVLIGRCTMVNGRGVVVWAPRPPEPLTTASLLKLKSNWFNGAMICQPEAFFRLDAFRAVGGLDESDHYAMDHRLWVDFALRGARFKAVDHPIARMLVHPGQKSADNRAVVRALLDTTAHVLARPEVLGKQHAAVQREVDSMRHKLACADAISKRWEAWRRRGNSTTTDMAADDLSAARNAASLGPGSIRNEVDQFSRPHGVRLLRKAFSLTRVRSPRCMSEGVPRDWSGDALGRRRRRRIVAADEECDLVILNRPPNPDMIERSWAELRPGGYFIVVAVPAPAERLDDYLVGLETLLDRHLSTNDDLILHPEADSYVEQILAEHISLEQSAGDRAAEIWLASDPWIPGLDLLARMEGLGAEAIEEIQYGSTWFHPIAPFPFVPLDGVRQVDMWQAGIWRKPPIA